MNETIESKKVVYPTGDLAKVWNDIDPQPVLQGRMYSYGSRLFTKMIEFLQVAQFTKADYEFYKNLGPARAEDETFEDYKIRQKFQKAISKYAVPVKAAVFMNTIEMLQARAKAQENEKETANTEA